jgi:ubiquinone/menaquinone biosynthesis C-methylase UbiE
MKVSAELSAHYQGRYSEISEWRRIGAVDKANNIVALCSHLEHNVVLEIGAGDGSLLRRLSELNFGKSLYALDITGDAIEAIASRGITTLVEAKVFDGYTLPYPDHSIDLVVLSHVVEHLEHPRVMLYEARRVAKRIFVEVPLEDTLRLRQHFVMESTGHINFYSRKTIRLLLESSRLEVEREMVTLPRRAVYRYAHGARGNLAYFVKRGLLIAAPGLAMTIFPYHCSFVCRPHEKRGRSTS